MNDVFDTIPGSAYTALHRLPTSFQVGRLTITPNVVLAPMAGITDSLFRRLILHLGECGLVVGEMTNAASVTPRALRRHKLLDFLPEERPIALQITGNDPDLMVRAAVKVEELGADVLDINCGCPAPKVTGGGHGASLLCNLPRLSDILVAVRAAVSIPITLKYRAGWNEESINYLETARRAETAGVDALTLHPRTRDQRYTGQADWNRIAAVKRAVGIPVVGSGDIDSAVDALNRMAASGVDGVMIGRAALANPWIFQQVAQLRRGIDPAEPTLAEKQALLLRYFTMALEALPEPIALNKLKQFIGHFFIGAPGSAALRASVQRSRTAEQARAHIDRAFDAWCAADPMRSLAARV